MQKSAIEVTLTSIMTLVILVVLVGVANLLPVQNPYVVKVLEFMNTYMLTIIFFILFLFLGELFYIFSFPINIFGPIFYAYGGYFLTTFIFKVFYLIESFMSFKVFSSLKFIEGIIGFLVFLIILVVGISKILSNRNINEPKNNSKEITWNDVGSEFKRGLYNIGVIFRKETKKKKINDKKKKRKNRNRI